MFAKTVCKPGSHIFVVPVGLRTTLQYNSNGVLEKVFCGYDQDKKNISDCLLSTIKKSNQVPTVVPIQGGTTWVQGVFYTDKLFKCCGILPYCVEPLMIKDMKDNITDYSFYAGRVDSLAASFKGVVTARNWLSMSAFRLLPSYVIPAGMTDTAFAKMVDNGRYPFKFPLISGYMIFENGDYRYHPVDLNQSHVKATEDTISKDGYMLVSVKDDEGTSHSYSKADCLSHNVIEGSLIVYEGNGKILFSDTCAAVKPRRTTCPTCGNTFMCPISGPVCCTDPHCVSRMYPYICKFAETLNLPVMSYDKFSGYVKKKKILCFTDVLLMPEYNKIKISCTLARLLQAVVPVEVCSDLSTFGKLSSVCNNSVKTFKYYLDNTGRLQSDIGSVTLQANKLISWMSDPQNALMLNTLIDSDQFTILESIKKFEGAPMFRGKTIAITGKFRHGDLLEVTSILASYDAKVTCGIVDTADCLVIGDLKEEIDGRSIQIARSHNIPTFDESQFFNMYSVDEDISANLL